MFLQEHEIANFPVAHLSVSAIRQYMSDRQMFFRRYIRLEFDETKGPALIEGSLYHFVLEQYWKSVKEGNPTFFRNDILEEKIEYIKKDDEKGLIDWGSTGSLEKSLDIVKNSLEFYYQALAAGDVPFTEVVDVECKFLTDFEDLEGNPMPIPLKGFTDLIVKNGEDLVIRDHKLVSFITPQDEPNPGFEIQAGIYWFLIRKNYGLNPARMFFDQMKKTKNRDGSPQLVPYCVEFTPLLLEKCLELYRRICCELAGRPLIDENGIARFIPNPFSMFGGEDSWNDFSEEVEQKKQWNLSEFRKNKYDLAGVEAVELDL